ncbi:MAG: amidase [Desulfomonilaceae bacterium]
MRAHQDILCDLETSKAFIETFILEPTGSGPLDGLTFAVKDLIDIAGHKTSCGNPTWRDTHPVAVANAVCVDHLLLAGGRCIGKTVTDELAFGMDGENFFYGTPTNPKAPDRVPGGSSSGSASAVSCGLVDFALGTDTGGSVRVPASNCGIFGMRPSYGAISVAGVNPLAPTFDTVGVLACDSDVLSKAMSTLLTCDVPSQIEIGTVYLLEEAFAISDPEIRGALAGPVERIKQLFPGKVKAVSLREIDHKFGDLGLRGWYDTYCRIQWAEIWSCLGAWVTEATPQFGDRVRANFEHVKNMDRKIIADAVRDRRYYFELLRSFLGEDDLLCMPTTPALAPTKGSLGIDRTKGNYFPRTLSLTAVAVVAKLPQITLPLASVDGVPIGLSLLGAHGMDAFLLGTTQLAASGCRQ